MDSLGHTAIRAFASFFRCQLNRSQDPLRRRRDLDDHEDRQGGHPDQQDEEVREDRIPGAATDAVQACVPHKLLSKIGNKLQDCLGECSFIVSIALIADNHAFENWYDA